MKQSQIVIDQLFSCKSYSEALKVSKAFERFNFLFFDLGGKRTIHAKRYIHKSKVSDYSHRVTIRFVIDYHGSFLSYGFIDKKTQMKYPELPLLLSTDDIDERYEIIEKYDDSEIYYYRDFDFFLDQILNKHLEKLHLAEVIAFAGKYTSSYFFIQYEEKGISYEKFYCVPLPPLAFDMHNYESLCNLGPISMNQVWVWSNENYYSKIDKNFSEAKPLIALSYVVNRMPFERLLYAVIGLESVYTNNSNSLKKQLIEKIPEVFPFITEKDVESFYKVRSNFIHGNIVFPLSYNNDNIDRLYLKYLESAQKASNLLLSTIRLLVNNNAIKIRLDYSGKICFIKGEQVRNKIRQGEFTKCNDND